ncbi:response regulator [Zavarzinella formosa]|uniref:hypothetical protein n=1 Tax=Zavarzinella formosa TaxID=360055 RepID=UPI000369B800|nr:hypothetical protein [Zavarzinella formosa]
MSANSGEEHTRQCENAGFDYSLSKTVEPAELERALTMIDRSTRLAFQIEDMALRKSADVSVETKELLREVKEDIVDVKRDVGGRADTPDISE